MQQMSLLDPVANSKPILQDQFMSGAKRVDALLNNTRLLKIHDYLSPPEFIGFNQDDGINLQVITPDGGKWFKIHKHAMQQICSKLKFPFSYLSYLASLGADGDRLSCKNLEELLSITPFKKAGGEGPSFLIRTVGPKVYGFLSNRYALHLSTDPLLERFVEYCAEQGAKAIGAEWNEVKLQARCALPHIYTPFPGLNIAVGMAFFNSDFGAGTFSVSPTVWDIDRGFATVLPKYSLGDTMDQDLFNKIHLGPVLTSKDINLVSSERGRRVDTVAASMRMNIQARLSKDFCATLCKALVRARDTEVSWPTVKRKLAGDLLKEELAILEKLLQERSTPTTLRLDEDGLPIPTKWWTSQAVSFVAARTADVDRKIDLQRVAGSFIE